MNDTNSFNICTRCGNSNALSAKYCSRCGAQLKAPEQPIYCPECNTRNASTANFCRSCGANLRVTTAATKTCPSCGREVNATDNVCACGYSFVTAEQSVKGSKKDKSATKISTNKSRKVYAHKGARAFSAISLVVLLIFAYYVLVPYRIYRGEIFVATLRPTFLVEADKGFEQYLGMGAGFGMPGYLYGFDLIAQLFTSISADFVTAMGGMGNILIAFVTLIFATTLIAQLVESIVRLCINKRAKHFNWYCLAMGIVSALIFALITVFNSVTVSSDFATKVASVFTLSSDYSLGYALWAIPIYYLLYFVFSIFAKAKALKETA